MLGQVADYAGGVRCEFLGPFRLSNAGASVDVGGPVAQAVLVSLVRWPGTVIGVDQLVEAVWGSAHGVTPDSVYHYVSKLRRSLAGVGLDIEGRLPGYRIRVDRQQVDAHRFDDLLRSARQLGDTDPEEAIHRLRLGLALWRGPRALPGVSVRGVRLYAQELDGRRLDAEEALAELELVRGNPAAVLDRLRSLQASHPNRRRLGILLARAQELTRRDAEAGTPPGDHRTLRTGGKPLAYQAPYGAVLSVAGDVAAVPVPFQLPAATRHFTGRDAELARLVGLWEDRSPATARTAAVAGMGGVGKTAFVVLAAHRLASRFPGGVLFTDLRGFTPDARSTSPEAALDTLLRGLGVRADRIPPALDARVALYRSVLAGRQVLVVLDNAAEESQVRPLLPGTADCMALVTSRRRMAGLDDAEHIALDVLEPADAIALLVRVAGDRAAGAGQQVIEDIVRLCGFMPLAIRIIAARLRISRSATAATLLAELRAEDGPLAALDDGERSIAHTLAVSYRHLPPAHQQAFRRLGMHTGPDTDLDAAAALLDLDAAAVGYMLNALEAASLVDQPIPGRFTFHNLICAFAARRDPAAHTDDDRLAARTRLFDHYLHATDRANRLVMPHRFQIPLDGQTSGTPAFDSRESALRWLDAERHNLTAICRLQEPALDSRRWQLTYLLRDFFYLRKHLEAWIETHRLALAGCERRGDELAEARTRNNLGRALLEIGRRAEASAEYERALALFERVGDEHGRSNALANQATILRAQGEYEAALENQRTALAYYRRAGATRNTGITLRAMALSEAPLGRVTEAAAHASEALEIALGQRSDIDAAQALNALGLAHYHAGEDAAAQAAHQQAIAFSRECGSTYEHAKALHSLGRIAARAGELEVARGRWTEAHELFRALGVPRAEMVLADLTALPHR